jgi:hypothetical protein
VEPFTMQDFVETVRADKPFLLITGATNTGEKKNWGNGYSEGAYRLRAEGSAWKAKLRDPTYDNFVTFDVMAQKVSGSDL